MAVLLKLPINDLHCLENSFKKDFICGLRRASLVASYEEKEKSCTYILCGDVSCRSYLITGLDCGLDYWTELMDWIVEQKIELIARETVE